MAFLTLGEIAWTLGFGIFFWCAGTTFYRLYLCDIAHFPGPKLAALTLWVEFYYDVVCKGQYTFKIQEWHKKYGPIIRINPYEIHINTPEYYEKLYPGHNPNNKRDKYEWWTKMFASPSATFPTVDHDTHRMRRAAMNLYFSKASVRRLQPLINERVDKFMDRIKGFKATGEVLPIGVAYVAFSSDVVCQYAFGRCYHRIEKGDFDPAYAQSMHEAAGAAWFNKQFLWPFQFLIWLPAKIATFLAPGISLYIAFIKDCEKQIKSIMDGSSEKQEQTTIFHELLTQEDLPPSEKTLTRLLHEGQTIVSAGTETTGWCLSVITYHLLANPALLRRLRQELEEAIPDPHAFVLVETLETLPFLSACINEGLRLAYGLSTRLARINPDNYMIFNDGKDNWPIPPGTPTSMTSYLIHHNESIFPDSHNFIPQRWLDDPRLDRYLVSFSKGTRGCIGINLAYAELYTCLASIFRQYGGLGNEGPLGKLELFETTIDDVKMVADRFVPFVKEGSKGVRVRVT